MEHGRQCSAGLSGSSRHCGAFIKHDRCVGLDWRSQWFPTRSCQYSQSIWKTKGISNLLVNWKSLPATCYIITSSGIIPYRDDTTPDAFSGDPRTQLVGLSICALAHCFYGAFAVRTFMRCLAPKMLPKDCAAGIREALRSQLTKNVDRILNEGCSRGPG